MKFFWKIFFTVMFVSVTCLALGGYILINSNLHTLLDKEVQTAYDYGDIAYFSLANELKTANLDLGKADSEMVAKAVSRVAPSININNMNQKISFGVLDNDGSIVYSSLGGALDKEILSSLGDNQKGWILRELENSTSIQAVRPALLGKTTFYIETVRDATYIFDGQKQQYETLLKMMAGMILLAGLLTLVISRLLMRRIVSLSKVTKEISVGNLSKRAETGGSDEIMELSENFNRMADDLEEKMKRLQDEADEKELFAGAFSHEVKTPLTSIIGYSDIIRRKKISPEQLQTCAEYIFSEGKRLEALSARLMELIVLKNRDIYRVGQDMESFLREICMGIEPQLKQRNIRFFCQVEPAVISLEPDLIKTVFLNLIDNGKKAMDTDGKLSIIGRWKQGVYTVSVSDTGKGMERQELSKIKTAFYMADKSRSRSQGGAGLGLAICDEILKRHGFEITFESKINVGTTVTIIMGEVKQ